MCGLGPPLKDGEEFEGSDDLVFGVDVVVFVEWFWCSG